MARILTPEQAREMSLGRKIKSGGRNGGRPRVPQPCPKCGKMCKSRRKADGHCL